MIFNQLFARRRATTMTRYIKKIGDTGQMGKWNRYYEATAKWQNERENKELAFDERCKAVRRNFSHEASIHVRLRRIEAAYEKIMARHEKRRPKAPNADY